MIAHISMEDTLKGLVSIHRPTPILLICIFLTLTGCCNTYNVHVLDGAEQELRNAFIKRDRETVDLEAVGRKLVADYGKKVALRAAVGVWQECSGRTDLNKARDIIWLSTQTKHTQSAAWMINFKDQWLQ